MSMRDIINFSRVSSFYWLFIALLVLSSSVGAETLQHAGPILQDTTWHSGDEHIVVGDVTVYDQATLTIEPGTTIKFAAHSDSTGGGQDSTRSELIINGALIAEGTEVNPIVFTSNTTTPQKGDWGGIHHQSRYPLVLRHVIVEYGSSGVDYRVSGSIVVNPVIENSVIRYSEGTGLYIEGSNGATVTAQVQGTVLQGHTGMGLYLSNGWGSFLQATIKSNTFSGNGQYGIYFTNNGETSQLLLQDNEVRENQSGIYLYNNYYGTMTPQLEDNRLHHNSYTGLAIYSNGGQFRHC